jgi:sialate O-acetylesterase
VERFPALQARARLALGALAVLVGTAGAVARAEVKLPALFSDHMVLQRDQPAKVWGWATPGEEVKVQIAGQTKTAKTADDGSWSVQLDPLPAGGPHTLTIACADSTRTIQDVLVGEVWICSGQSNMQWDINATYDADLEALTAKSSAVRLISVPQVGTQELKNDFDGKWEIATPETVRSFSAVGYLYGRQIHETLGVPVGLIDDAWGGSAAEAWVRRDILEKDPKYADLIKGWQGMEAAYNDAATPADKKKQLEGQMRGNARPGNIYNGVLKPTIGYGIRGAIWYQGESNAGRAYQYRDLFPLMIQSWRDEWGIGDFPFFWVQLADFMAEKPEPGDSAWAELREAQTMTLSRLPNTGQAVIIDIGEGKDIHPRNKLDVARRLARWALATVYGVNIPYQSPTYKSMKVEGNKVVLTFDHVGSGLSTFDVDEARGFAVAGEDKAWHWATSAKVTGADTIEVSCDKVSAPVAVRYGWADNPVVNVYSKEHLPLTPFRTDDWPGVTAQAK